MRWFVSLIGNLIALTAAFGLLARYVSPRIFWPPAVVALALPGLLALTFLFLLFALSRRRRWPWAVLPAVVVACSVPILGQLFAWSGPAEPVTGATVTFVTGNQRLFRTEDGEPIKASDATKFFHELTADVLLLQEIHPPSNKLNFVSSIEAGQKFQARHQERGTLVATYAPEIEPVSAYFTKPNEYNGFLVSDVKTELGTIRVINAHLESNNISGMTSGIGADHAVQERAETFARMLAGYGRATRRRAEQAEEIRRLVETSPHPVIVGGDFNDVPSSYIYHTLSSPRLRDAWVARGSGLGATFTGPLPGLRIDYFLVDTSLNVVSVERLDPHWSDHRPLSMVVSGKAER